jgi:rhodanese-related sulfurtransferase
MATAVTLPELQELTANGAQLVEVLPEAEYEEAHLPGAINIPLKRLDASTVAVLERDRPVVVYCWDSL